MKTLQELEELTLQWFKDRQIIPNSTPFAQCVKLFEEFTELLDGINKNDIDLIKDSIGDIAVVLIGLNALQGGAKLFSEPKLNKRYYTDNNRSRCALLGGSLSQGMVFEKSHEDSLEELDQIAYTYKTSLDECLELAYEEIKDRKGTLTPEGIFVKETK